MRQTAGMRTAGIIDRLLVVAHPDDEIIGAGNYLAALSEAQRRNIVIVYVTDGVPRNPRWALAAGFKTNQEYFEARRKERDAALEIAGVDRCQCRELGFADQDVALHLTDVTKAVAGFIDEVRPETVLTHPYEGGHPDHDACAFACHLAVGSQRRPRLEEFACYHGGPRGFTTQEFLPAAGIPITVICLDADERLRKQRMFDCHRSQEPILRLFSTRDEKFRPAPSYDFLEPPHEGPLHYETLGWDITGAMWREFARQAHETYGT